MNKIKEYFITFIVRLSVILFALTTAILIVLALPWILVYWVFAGRNILNDVILLSQKMFNIEIE